MPEQQTQEDSFTKGFRFAGGVIVAIVLLWWFFQPKLLIGPIDSNSDIITPIKEVNAVTASKTPPPAQLLQKDTASVVQDNHQANKPEIWYDVKKFTGTSAKTTESFKINSRKWRYTLSCSGTSDAMYNLEINTLINNEPSQVDFKMMVKCSVNEEPNYVYEGPGEYFFDLFTANVDSWTIKVEGVR